MTDHDPDDIERSLGRLVPKPAPPGLRERAATAALDARKNVALTPGMRVLGAVCLAFIVAAGLGDAVVSRAQTRQLMSLLDGHDAIAKPEEDAGYLLAEIAGGIGGLYEPALDKRIVARMGIREEPLTDWRKARERLKGMIDHEDPENIY